MITRVAVTGATGFIGGRLCSALRERGFRVTAVVRRGGQAGPWDDEIVADISRDDIDPRALRGVRAVFHFAGKAHALSERAGGADSYQRINLEGTRRVLEAASAAKVRRFVFASSVKAMGNGWGSSEPETPYARTKLEAERLVLGAGMVAEPVVLRLALVYGPGMKGNLGDMLQAVKRRRFPPPPPIDNRRSLVHVDDVVRVAIAAYERDEAVGRVFVVGDGIPYSTHAIYAAMCRALGREVPGWSLPAAVWRALAAAGDAAGAVARRRVFFDTDSYEKLFGSAWYPTGDLAGALGITGLRTLEEALAEMVRER